MPSRYTSATNSRTPCTIVMAPGTGVCAPTVVAIATTNIDATMPAKIVRFISSALSARAAQTEAAPLGLEPDRRVEQIGHTTHCPPSPANPSSKVMRGRRVLWG